MCVCTSVSTSVSGCVCVYVHVHVYVCVNECVSVYVYVHTCMCSTCVSKYVHVHFIHGVCMHAVLQYGAWATLKKLRCWQNPYCTAGSAQHMLCILV